MKFLYRIAPVVFILILFSECARMDFTTRRYRKGIYISHSKFPQEGRREDVAVKPVATVISQEVPAQVLLCEKKSMILTEQQRPVLRETKLREPAILEVKPGETARPLVLNADIRKDKKGLEPLGRANFSGKALILSIIGYLFVSIAIELAASIPAAAFGGLLIAGVLLGIISLAMAIRAANETNFMAIVFQVAAFIFAMVTLVLGLGALIPFLKTL
jgi:hypothetical protein